MKDSIKKEILDNRNALKPDWAKLRTIKTDRNLELPRPIQFKQATPEMKIIDLPIEFPNIKQKTLAECIKNRRSLRKYSETPFTFEEVTYLLWETARIDSHRPGITFRTIPTGGATNAMETYIYFNNVEGYKKGIYLYIQDKHQLALIEEDDSLEQRMNNALNRQLRGASIVVILSAVPYRSEYKYSFTAHKMIAMEAGHACQNLSLAAEIVEGGAVALAAYNQTLVDEVLQLDGVEEFSTYCIPVGKK